MLRNWRRNSRNEKICSHSVTFEVGTNKASSSAMANFVEGVVLIDLIESGEQFIVNLKDGLPVKRSIFPEWIDDERLK